MFPNLTKNDPFQINFLELFYILRFFAKNKLCTLMFRSTTLVYTFVDGVFKNEDSVAVV